ncbi:MAG: hypothetical protein R3325_04075 [Thermoanaerobaculia bacterium]|nr:hypothetical protein [Thermoanaerobaculia bacterium]
MFRQFAASIDPAELFQLHPAQIEARLEQAWDLRVHDESVPVGHPAHRSDLEALPDYELNDRAQPFATANASTHSNRVLWDHLIYAFMIENTRIFEVFRRVLEKFVGGEELGVPLNAACSRWLRNTEELFFRQPAPFFIRAIDSRVRPDIDATRRRAYYRMFGMRLNHDVPREGEMPPRAANTEFVYTFEELLREVWVGIENEGNRSGSNPTDDAEIANLAEKLHDMLRTRRLGSNLSREEFYAVSAMSWFHLTVESDSQIVLALRADGASPEQRLSKIAERVGLPSHALSKSFFDIADAISRILVQIETGVYNAPAAVRALYIPTDPPGPEADMRTIITHWSITTGRELKTRRVVARVDDARAVPAPSPAASGAGATG